MRAESFCELFDNRVHFGGVARSEGLDHEILDAVLQSPLWHDATSENVASIARARRCEESGQGGISTDLLVETGGAWAFASLELTGYGLANIMRRALLGVS